MEVYTLDASGNPTATPIQTYYLRFPNATLPVPASINNNSGGTPASTYLPSTAAVGSYDFLSFLDSYGASVNANTMGSAWGRLSFPTYIPFISKLDVVRAVVASDPSISTGSPTAPAATPGDLRLIAARQFVPDQFYLPLSSSSGFLSPSAGTFDYYDPTCAFSHMLRIETAIPFYGAVGGKLISTTAVYDDYQRQYFQNAGVDIGDSNYSFGGGSGVRPKDTDIANQDSSILLGNKGTIPGDWDNGFQNSRDGAFINKADEGDAGGPTPPNNMPYYELDYGNQLPGPTFFSPNRMIPSPGMFGSLPSGRLELESLADAALSSRAGGPSGARHAVDGPVLHHAAGPSLHGPFQHAGGGAVCDQYAAGNGGANQHELLIVPFTYINRDTGLRAAMKSQMVTAIPNTAEGTYKLHANPANGYGGSLTNTRYTINMDSTLSQFLARFYNTNGTQGADGAPDIFRSASEICDVDLVPNDTTGGTSTFLTHRRSRGRTWTNIGRRMR